MLFRWYCTVLNLLYNVKAIIFDSAKCMLTTEKVEEKIVYLKDKAQLKKIIYAVSLQ